MKMAKNILNTKVFATDTPIAKTFIASTSANIFFTLQFLQVEK